MAGNQPACAKHPNVKVKGLHFTANLELLCRRHKWQCFVDEKRKRPKRETEQGEEKEPGSEGSDADAEDEGDGSGEEEEEQEDEEYRPSQREIKNRKRRWRKEEDSAVLWNIVKCVIKAHNDIANICSYCWYELLWQSVFCFHSLRS